MTEVSSPPAPVRERAEVWEEWSSWPLLVLSLGFVALSTIVLADNNLSPGTQNWATIGMLVMWALFLLDFAIRFFLSGRGWEFLRRNLFEAVTLLLPFLRSFLLVLYLWRLPGLKRSRRHQRMRFMLVAASFGFIFVYVASTLVWLLEHNAPEANIRSFGDAIWWGFATIATVGYGDYTPVTVPGRIVAVGLMLGGMVIVAIITATVISSLTEQVQRGVEAARLAEAQRAVADAAPAATPDDSVHTDRNAR